MSYTKNEGIESLRRSLLLMSYDAKKTLSENVEEILSEQTNLDSMMIDLRKAVYGGGTNEKLLIQAINKLTSKAEYDALNKEIRNNPGYFAMGTALGGGPKNLQDILNGDLGRDNVYTAQQIQKKLATIGINMTFKSYNYGGVPAGTAGKYLTPNSITIGGAASGGKTGTGAASGGKTGTGAASGGKTGAGAASGGKTGAGRSKYIPIGKNDCVIKIQTFLKGQGFTLGPKDVDGVYGPFTIRAVQEYQRKNGLTPDGIWGPATAAKTENQIPPCGVTQTTSDQTTTTDQTTTNPTDTTNSELGTTKIDPRNVYDRFTEPKFNIQQNPKLDLSLPAQTTSPTGMEIYNNLNAQGKIGPVRMTNGRIIKYTGQEPLPTEVSKYLSDLGYIQRKNNEWIKR